MKHTKLLFCTAALLGLFSCVQAFAAETVQYTTSFENNETAFPFALGGLDQNFTSGPNASPDGTGGNPFVGWGPMASNANGNIIGTSAGGIVPHTGTQQLCGDTVNHTGHDYINLTYRVGHGTRLTGNFSCEWWVRDPNGKDSTAICKDYVTLGNYVLPTDKDFTDSGSTADGTEVSGTPLSLLALGMWQFSYAWDYGAYQARIIGPNSYWTNLISNAPSSSGWWNLPVRRTAAWHHMKIVVGPLLADQTNTVAFFVDDMDHAGLVYNSMVPSGGFTLLDFITYKNYSASHVTDSTAYYDDVTISTIDPACTIDGVKDAPLGALVSADGAYITAIGGAVPTDCAYVQTSNRASAVMIKYNNPNDSSITGVNAAHYTGLTDMLNNGAVQVGSKICAMGILKADSNGEKYVDAYSVYPMKDLKATAWDSNGNATAYAAYTVVTQQTPVGMNNRDALTDLAQGKYIKTWGKVSNVSGSDSTISDGSQQTIHVSNGTNEVLSEGETITVCGVMGKDSSGPVLYASEIVPQQ